MGLADCYARPRRLVLRGVAYHAAELRFLDLARLEALARRRLGDPVELAAPEPPETYRPRLRAAYDLAEGGGASWGSPECDAVVFGTRRGLAALLRAVLRASRLGADEARALADALSEAEWSAVFRAAFALHPLTEIHARIDREIGVVMPEPPRGPERRPDWRKRVAELCRLLRRTPWEVMHLTPSEASLVLSGGADDGPDFDRPAWLPSKVYDEHQRLRRAFWAEGEPGVSG
jgi:hypothetical protein